MPTKLYKHQQRILDANPERLLLCWDCGTGKSLASIEWAKLNGGSTLIVVPKSIKEKWQRDVKGHLTWTVMTKEEFRKIAKHLPKYENLIVDESHFFSGMNSLMAKALYNYIKSHKPRRLLLTATPYLSTPWNIFVLGRHLGHEWHYMDFKERFFINRYIGRRVIPQVRDGIEGDIASLVGQIGDVVRLDECVDVPDQIFEAEQFDLTAAQKKAIKDNPETNPIVRFTKNHEIENGFLYKEFMPTETYDCDKLERIIQLCFENGKIAVVCRYNEQINVIRAALEKSGRDDVFIIRGDVKDRDAVVREVEARGKAVVLINASCSEGYELPSIGVIVFASLSFSYKDYKQVCGRFLRINRLKKNVYIHLVTDGGVDAEVYKSVMKKQDFSISIYSQGML